MKNKIIEALRIVVSIGGAFCLIQLAHNENTNLTAAHLWIDLYLGVIGAFVLYFFLSVYFGARCGTQE